MPTSITLRSVCDAFAIAFPAMDSRTDEAIVSWFLGTQTTHWPNATKFDPFSRSVSTRGAKK
jgi:hypothetical protein